MSTPRIDRKKLAHLQRLGSYMLFDKINYPAGYIRQSINAHNYRKHANRKYRVVEHNGFLAVVLIQNREFRLEGKLIFDGILYKGNRVNV